MKIALHAINGVGLGHLVRTLSIAHEIVRLAPATEILFLTNARDTTLLDRAAFDYVQFPPRLAEPHADPDRVERALPEPLEDAAMMAALTTFAPDLVVFDTHAPAAVVRALPAIGARAVLVLRELRPDALRAFAASAIADAFDRIVVPHEAGEIDATPLAHLPTEHVGPIVRLPLRSDDEGRLPRADVPRVLAMAGGGGQPIDAARYVRAVADAHLLARAVVPSLETVLVTGPYGSPPPDASIYAGLTVLATTDDLGARLAQATVVVSQAGYNAVAEIRALRKAAVFVPGHRKAEDQRTRATRLVRAGAAAIAKPEARAIADRLLRLLTDPARRAAMERAHDEIPLRPKNREAALATLRPLARTTRTIERIVLVAHDFAPKVGGMESVAKSLAASLLERGIALRVLTTDRLGAARASGLPDGAVLPVFVPRAPPTSIDLWPDLLTTIDICLRDPPDVIHLCHAGLAPWIPALRAALPSIVTIHVHGNDLLAPWVFAGVSPEAYRALRERGFAHADAVVPVSRFSAALARADGVPPEHVHTIENGIDVPRFAPRPRDEALAARLGLAPLASLTPAPRAADELVVLTVSRLAPRKGHATVVRALAKLRAEATASPASRRPLLPSRIRYVFTGASESLVAELRALALSLGVGDLLVPTGFVAEAELPALYTIADVFVLLSEGEANDVEGFGIALLEAAAAGLPTVATRAGGIPEAVIDGETGILVPPGDPDAAAEAIAALATDRALRERLGSSARARVATDFSRDVATTRLLDVWAASGREPLRTARRDVRPVPETIAHDAEASAAALAIATVTNGAELVRLARARGAADRLERTQRRATFREMIARGRVVRLRATGNGARLLAGALADCEALGHTPRVEVKLRRFLDPDFLDHALAKTEGVELVHGVPHENAERLLARARALRPDQLRRVRSVRLHLTPEARVDERAAVGAVVETHALRKLFTEHGAIVVPPPELMRYLSELPAGGPTTGMIEPTNLCNLACPTCPTGTGKIPPLPAMSLARFEDVLAPLAPRMRNLALWNYGEPLLNRDLPKMIAHAKKSGVEVVKVSSNVHFLDGARGRALLESGLDVLILSVDGASQATYATFRKDGDFTKVASAVAWLCAEKKRLGLSRPRIELQFIAMRHNEHELPEMRRLAKEWGVDRLRVKTVGAEDDATKNLVPAARLLSRYAADNATPNVRHSFCTMAWDHTVVNVDGSVTPCCYLRPDMGPEFVMGNVFESSFTAIWRGERYRAFRAKMLAGREAMPVCNRCRGGTHDLLAAVEEVAPS